MRLFIATDFRTVKNGEKYYLASQYYHIIRRYKEQFGEVILCSRYVESEDVEGLFSINDIITDFLGVPSLMRFFKRDTRKKMLELLRECDMAVGRYPAVSASIIHVLKKKAEKPLYAEVMADPWDSYWNHSIKGKVLAPFAYLYTKNCVLHAQYALYVTKEFLQKRYPTKGRSIGVSDVKIDSLNVAVLNDKIDRYNAIEGMKKKEITLMTTAAVDVRFKGQEYVIKAIPKLNDRGIRVKYLLVGSGDSERLLKIARRLGVEKQIEFLGVQVPEKVFEFLDKTDIYVQPSLQEGLPRAVVEAMSRACVCIGARTGGIPELLPTECVFKRKSPDAIAQTIIDIMRESRLIEFSKICFDEAGNYTESKLDKKRNTFYAEIKSKYNKNN